MTFSSELRDISRMRQVVEVFLWNGFAFYVHSINNHEKLFSLKKGRSSSAEELPRLLRESFQELGGAYIKLGQLLSIREDLVPQAYSIELAKLQDSVRSFPYQDVKRIIEEELGRSMHSLFLSFSQRPVASASVGQVHRAVLRDGRIVAVKIQRPGISEQMKSDMEIIFKISQLLQRHLHPAIINPVAIAKEFEEYSKKELDYLHEARNLDSASKQVQDYFVPAPILELCSPRILVMEYIEGEKLPRNSPVLARKLMDAVYHQVFETGLFHADPHPGNLLVRKGKIAIIDWGITGYLGPELREKLVMLLESIVEKDTRKMADTLISLGVSRHPISREKLENDLFESFSQYYGKSLSGIRVSSLLSDMMDVAKKNHIRLPSNLVLLTKCVITTEAVVRRLDPKFSPVEHAQPFILKFLKKRYSARNILSQIGRNGENLSTFISKVPQLGEELMDGIEKGEEGLLTLHKDMGRMAAEMDKTSSRISLSLLITALLIASSMIMSFPQQKVLGMPVISLAGFSLAMLFLFILLISFWKGKI